jgi:hypothetical protein
MTSREGLIVPLFHERNLGAVESEYSCLVDAPVDVDADGIKPTSLHLLKDVRPERWNLITK